MVVGKYAFNAQLQTEAKALNVMICVQETVCNSITNSVGMASSMSSFDGNSDAVKLIVEDYVCFQKLLLSATC